MSKSRNNIPRAAIHVGAPAKSFYEKAGLRPQRTIMEWRPEKRD